ESRGFYAPSGWDLIAMAHYELGHSGQSQEPFKRMKELMQGTLASRHPDNQFLASEATSLLGVE
ncbi:MAG: hypothetical protein ACE5E5_14860, partial [Phycisphaerae bacterium]